MRLDEKKDPSWEAGATVKLRPARRSQLSPPWDRAHEAEAANPHGKDRYKYRIEQDWAGTRQALAASLEVAVDPDLLPSEQVPSGRRQGTFAPHQVFTDEQRHYLAACADRRVTVNALTPLGPIEAIRWQTMIGKFDTKVERWTLEGLDFLELSIQLESGSQHDPLDRLIAFSTAAARGLNPFSRQETKTRRVLEHLAHRSASRPPSTIRR